MSIQALNWALEQRVGSGVRKLILLLIANRADEAHSCYPGVELLVWESELGASTIDNAIKQLVNMGLLRVLRRAAKKGGRKTNRYQLLVDGPDTPPPPTDDWTSEFHPKGSVDDPPDDGSAAAAAAAWLAENGDGAGAAGEEGDAAADVCAGSGKPLGAGGLPDGAEDADADADETAGQSKPLGAGGLGKPLGARDSNPSERGVSIEDEPKGFNPQIDTPPPYVAHPGGISEEEAAEAERAATRLEQARDVLRTVTAKVAPERLPRGEQAAKLVDLALQALTAGWDATRLTTRIGESLDGVNSVYAVLHSRLASVGPPPANAATSPAERRPEWCGRCNRDTRLDVDNNDRSVPCERCHPAKVRTT